MNKKIFEIFFKQANVSKSVCLDLFFVPKKLIIITVLDLKLCVI